MEKQTLRKNRFGPRRVGNSLDSIFGGEVVSFSPEGPISYQDDVLFVCVYVLYSSHNTFSDQKERVFQKFLRFYTLVHPSGFQDPYDCSIVLSSRP